VEKASEARFGGRKNERGSFMKRTGFWRQKMAEIYISYDPVRTSIDIKNLSSSPEVNV
jgi:hypothetical protein